MNQFTDAQSALLRAYDRRSGALLWHESISDPFSTMEAIVSEAGVVAIAGSRNRPVGGVGFIQAYDTRTGRFLWEHEVPLPDVPTFGFVVGLAAEGRRLFAAGASRGFLVQAHDIRTGTLLWQRESQAGLGGAMAITESRGIVFAVGPDDNDWLAQAYDAKTGDLVWEDRFDNAGSFDIARDDDAERGRLFVVGDVQTPTDFSDVLIRAYDADGKSRNKP